MSFVPPKIIVDMFNKQIRYGRIANSRRIIGNKNILIADNIKNQNKLQGDVLLKWVSIAPGFFIIVGILKAVTFYNYFGIDILEFITLGEALLISINDIIYLILIFIPMMLILWLIPESALNNIRMDPADRDNLSMMQFVLKTVNQFWFVFVGPSYLIMFTLIGAIRLNEQYNWMFFYLMLMMMLGCSIIFILFIVAVYRYKTPIQRKISLMIVTSIFIGLMILFKSYTRANKLKNKPEWITKAIVILNDSSVLNLSSQVVYLGKVHDYTFVYDRHKDEAIAIKNDNIKLFKFRETRESKAGEEEKN